MTTIDDVMLYSSRKALRPPKSCTASLRSDCYSGAHRYCHLVAVMSILPKCPVQMLLSTVYTETTKKTTILVWRGRGPVNMHTS